MTFEELQKVNEKLKSLDVKGKGYVQVSERVKGFRQLCPNGRIETEIVDLNGGVVTMKAYVYDSQGCLLATGYAQEKESSSYINKTSFIENCETSAVGRALGWCGIGVDASMASAEEVANAIINQNKPAYPSREEMIQTITDKNSDDPDNLAKILKWAGKKDLFELTDAQLQTAYNKAAKK